VDLTVEYRPQTHVKALAQSVIGLQIQNLFNQLYNVPVYNGCYGSPVSTGLQSGNAPCTYSTAPYAAPDVTAHSSAAYLTYPNLAPLSFRLYYQVTI
jgi:outer membrane receptor protein involved in Fe transport